MPTSPGFRGRGGAWTRQKGRCLLTPTPQAAPFSSSCRRKKTPKIARIFSYRCDKPADPSSIFCSGGADPETLLTRPCGLTPPMRYSMRQSPQTGDVVREGYATMRAAVARAADLIEGGYGVEIWSPALLERQ